MQRKRTEEVERVFFAVDVSNFWHSCREVYGTSARVRFENLINKIKSDGREVKAVAYTVSAPRYKTLSGGRKVAEEGRDSVFLKMLKQVGFEVKTRKMRYEKGVSKPFHTDWDVGITIDALSLADSYDTFILGSGDGDFIPLLMKLQELGKEIIIYTFKNTTSSLYSKIGDVRYLDKADIYLAKK